MDRSHAIIEAALAVLTESGSRGLTHRAVDARASLPVGSTSNLYRTRQSLIEAIVEHLLASDRIRMRDLQSAGAGTLGGLAAAFASASLGLARHEIFARAALLTDPDAEGLKRAREALLENIRSLAPHLDIPDAVLRIVVALVDGVLFDTALNDAPFSERATATAIDDILARYSIIS